MGRRCTLVVVDCDAMCASSQAELHRKNWNRLTDDLRRPKMQMKWSQRKTLQVIDIIPMPEPERGQ